MHFIFSSKNEAVCRQVYQVIASDADCFIYYDDALLLLKDVCTNRISGDVLILDVSFCKGFSDFVYDVCISKNVKLPIVQFGDPAFDKTVRAQRWLSENEIRYDSYDMHGLIPLFLKINDALETVLPYAHTDDAVAESSERGSSLKKHGTRVIDAMRHEKTLSPASCNLFAFLYKNRRREISVSEIANHLNITADSEKERNNIVYAQLSRLKKFLAKSNVAQEYKLKLLRTRKGFYKLFLAACVI